MAPPRKHLYAKFKMSPCGPHSHKAAEKSTQQIHNVTLSQPIQQSAHGRCHNSALARLAPDLDDPLDDT